MCVPLPNFNSSVRDLAITSMYEIYRDADKVLVLDVEVMNLPTYKMNVAEKQLMIANCIWCTRLWTLQEGLVANELYSQVGLEAFRADNRG